MTPTPCMASISYVIVIFLLLTFIVKGRTQQTHLPKPTIEPGSSLSPTTHNTSWLSPSGRFAFGFYKQGSNGFAVGIWIVGRKNNNTIVWTANLSDSDSITSNAKLQLKMDGELVLQTEQGPEKRIDDANATASSASMLDSGNFVLYNQSHDIIWQSFYHPTDTILGDQVLPPGGYLLSSSSETNHSTGRFRLDMQYDGNLVLYPVINPIESRQVQDAYWATGTFGDRQLYLSNDSGALLIRTDCYKEKLPRKILYSGSHEDINKNTNTIYRATLDPDGVFRLYAHVDDGSGEVTVSRVWQAIEDSNLCDVKGICGWNSFCSINNTNQTSCPCILGFERNGDESLDCRRSFYKGECGDRNQTAALYQMVQMENYTDLRDEPYDEHPMDVEECKLSCLNDCNCGVARYDGRICKKQTLPLKYVRQVSDLPPMAFLKVGNASSGRWTNTQPLMTTTVVKQDTVQIVIIIICFLLVFGSAIAITSHLIYKIRVLRYERLRDIEDLGLNEGAALRIFSYKELKKATKDFKEELGKGSFGAVYKGSLHKGKRLIAVKRLEKLVEEGEREFQAEMRSIGKTHHRNLVRLLGYCAEGSNRLLVYEYMSNGSLGKLLFGARRPDWDDRIRIALDVARGILYLQEECESPIIHCDIKPQNILMDEFWTAKISDFGLAKLLMPDQTRTFTGARGTRGYVAPEWNKNVPVSVKADVYSYGVVLLEIVCCRRNWEVNVSEPEEIVLSNWAYKCFVARDLNKLVPGERVNENMLENMVKIGLWCIQDEPALRPTMKSVVLMLEGVADVSVPPCPTEYSI